MYKSSKRDRASLDYAHATDSCFCRRLLIAAAAAAADRKVRSHGVRAVRQMLARSWEDCEVFLQDWNPEPFKAVVKPLESAGSDDVYLCNSPEDVKEAFSVIDGKVGGCEDARGVG